jgi:hypothetical protein
MQQSEEKRSEKCKFNKYKRIENNKNRYEKSGEKK